MKTFSEFKEAMKDEALKKELDAYIEKKKPEDREAQVLALVAFAAEKGYAVTAEELGADAAKNRELSDEEIENAAGGVWCFSDYSCYTAWYHDGCDLIMDDCDENHTSSHEYGTK